jgi:tritrans,polycis-undecaprenyl-diphosphate synthase [geranylgeranyl-diphosphate specific]
MQKKEEKEKAINHVAIIPDGNRRWARKKRFRPWIGHKEGAKSFEKVLEKAREMGISYVTFWGGSWDNLTKRPDKEIRSLFDIYTEQFKRIVGDERIHQDKVKINVLGRWQEILPEETKKVIEEAINKTKDYDKYFLTFLLAYDGRDEMLNCFKKIVDSSRRNKIKINQDTIKENLWTKDLPPVDLVIRTGCQNDPHLSAGFMMWDTSYSQLHFTETFFPDFGPEEFKKIIKNYSERERRLGS